MIIFAFIATIRIMFLQTHKLLLDWYTKNGRHDLPWRNSDDPYHIWVSEIMLQQTQVKTVLERFYFPFFEAFPALQDLADADLDEVLKKWEGLGYYTRARNLHKAAQLSAPELPQTIEELVETVVERILNLADFNVDSFQWGINSET